MEPSAGPRRALVRKVLRDDVYDALLEMLLDTQTPAGAQLSIDGLARELGVSPTPVREALVQLEHTGLVSRAALKGYRVAPQLTPEQFANLMDARIVVEIAAVQRAMGGSASFSPSLRAAHARHVGVRAELEVLTPRAEALTAASMRPYYAMDWGFHMVIIRASGNPYLEQMLASLGTHVQRLRQSVGHGISDSAIALQEHAAILAAVEGGTADEAAEAMRRHLVGVRDRAVAEQRSAELS